MRVLLLGVGGFIGSHLVDRLLRDPGYEIEGLDLTDEKLEEALGFPRFKFVRADIRHERETTLAMIRSMQSTASCSRCPPRDGRRSCRSWTSTPNFSADRESRPAGRRPRRR